MRDVRVVCDECKVDANATDSNGDGALNDAVRFGHAGCVSMLVSAIYFVYKSKRRRSTARHKY